MRCEAGGRVKLAGVDWSEPCMARSTNVLETVRGDIVHLCDEHFADVQRAGLVDDAKYVEPSAFWRRRRRG